MLYDNARYHGMVFRTDSEGRLVFGNGVMAMGFPRLATRWYDDVDDDGWECA